MRSFEEQLKDALARQSPPKDFTDRVLAAIEEQQHQPAAVSRPSWLRRLWSWRAVRVYATHGGRERRRKM